MSVVDDSFGHSLEREEKASAPLAGGIANMGYQCGMLWGAALAAGLQAERLLGPGPQAESLAIITTQRLVESFRTLTKNEINCLEISHLNMQGKTEVLPLIKFFLKGGPVGCFHMAARYAPVVYSQIHTTLFEEHPESPAPPVSCAAFLARKMGVSDLHTTMTAGFAGGIGLSGGACGALGVAIWISGMNRTAEPVGFNYSNTWIGNMIEKFLEITDFEVECSNIVGRKFENVSDHAHHLQAGGCLQVLETLATFG